MNTDDRRRKIMEALSTASSPIKASSFAERYGVSRQIIVGDIAILRAAGNEIIPTPQGYMLDQGMAVQENTAVLACKHTIDGTLDELYTIVDNGGIVIDVTIEHPVYGELHGRLNIASRFDADKFYEKLLANNAMTLSTITGGIHLHTIGFRDNESLARIKEELHRKGFLLDD